MTDSGGEGRDGDGSFPNGHNATNGETLPGEAGQAMRTAREALPSWYAEQVNQPSGAEQPSTALPDRMPQYQQEEPERRRRSGKFLLGVAGLLLLAGVAGLGYWFGTGDRGESVATDAEAAAPESPQTDQNDAGDGEGIETEGQPSTDGAQETDDPGYIAPDVNVAETFGFESDSVDELGRPVPVLPSVLYENTENPTELPYYAEEPIDAPADGPYTVIKGGFFFIRGSFANEAMKQELIKRNLAILPEEQIVVEYTVDPESEWYFGDPIPVFLQDKLLFDVGSTEVNPAFLPLFQIGANLTMIDPDVGIIVIGHTDSEGDDAFNLELSEARVNAVRELYIGFGANPEQIVAIGKGETEPRADNSTEEGRALNRRVEFIITSLEAEEEAG